MLQNILKSKVYKKYFKNLKSSQFEALVVDSIRILDLVHRYVSNRILREQKLYNFHFFFKLIAFLILKKMFIRKCNRNHPRTPRVFH